MITKIRTRLNKLTPGMTFNKYAKQVLYHGQDCGYIEMAGKRKYVLTPALEKLGEKLDLNDFDTSYPKTITVNEFQSLKHLLKPFISNEKGLKKMNLQDGMFYSPSPASIQVWDKRGGQPLLTIVKKLKYPTKDILYNAFPFLRKIIRVSPDNY